MENIGNFYDDNREGNTTKTNAPSDAQAEDSQAKVSSSCKWANWILTTFAISGWLVIAALIIDAIFNKSKLMEWILIGQ